MNRYLTQKYVAISWEDAVRRAHSDRTPIEKISRSVKVQLLHRAESWAWWSDHQLTTAIGLPPNLQPRALSRDAVLLIDEIRCSAAPPPQCGWELLAKIKRILKREVLAIGESFGMFQPETWEQLTVELCNGNRADLYCFWGGYERGYRCEVRTTPPRNLVRLGW